MLEALPGPATRTDQEARRTRSVPIGTLVISDSPRIAGENAEHIRVLAESDLAWPPITVHRPTMRVVDGVHRVRAALLRGEERIEADFVDGTVEEAFVLAVRLNTRHGMPLSRADRTAAATRLVESRPRWSNRRIAEIVGVSPTTVATLRDRSTGRTGQSNVRAGRDGRVRPLGAGAAEGRRRAVRVIRSRPGASLREIAAEAGVAVATARDVRQRLRVGEDPVPPRLRAAEVRDSGRGEASPAAGTPSAGDGKPAVTLPPEPAAHASARSLRKDPSLRFSEAGRTLLRLWSAHALDADQWQVLADSVPTHRLSDATWAARRCAEQWLCFARGMEERAALVRDRAS
ncbi:ParB N-terminal domain-containing protein [Streptomyces javensis]|uniref:ParB N-terminal domain-containing protein n=2 Tax=Streptomyces javensis TaxID=114698 RepID=A0ABN1X3P8_9ACTN|nr:ParB N-terminal domain-containing protein [Streptomyces javensis]